jgi:hypothetical protein
MVPGPVVTYLAQAGAATAPLLEFGVLGILSALALGAVRVLFQRETVALDLERRRVAELTAELARANSAMQQMSVTTLAEATRAISAALDATRERT